MTRSPLALGLALLAATGCATALVERTPAPPSPSAERYSGAVDWPKATDELAGVLSGYLQVDTTNPPGNETRGAEYLAHILDREGIESRIIEMEPGRGSLVARLRGRGAEPPLCLLSHIDVVTANAAEWVPHKGPLSGARDTDGFVWGRGALDMKGMGAVELMTLVWLKRLTVPLRRDVILLAVADEEVANRGMRLLVEKHWKEIGCSQLVNEGGMGVKDLLLPGQTVFPVSVAEKGVLWLKMTARGNSGHGSTPLPDTAPARLVEALKRLSEREAEITIHPSLYELLAEAGEKEGGLTGFILKRPFWVRRFVLGKLIANPVTHAAITNTVNVTGFRTPIGEPNVVPSEASAILDTRLLPGQTEDAMLAELRNIVGDDLAVDFEVLHSVPGNESPRDDSFFLALTREAVREHPDAVAGPALSPGFTDSIFVRPLGVHAYGFVPFVVDKELLATFHGRDERVAVASLGSGLRILFRAVLEVAADGEAPRPGVVDAPPPGSARQGSLRAPLAVPRTNTSTAAR